MRTSRRAGRKVHLIRRHPWVFLIVVTVVGFVLDIATKRWAVAGLEPREQVRLIGNVLSLVLVYNTGGVFGLDPRELMPWLPLNPFFYVFNVIAIGIVLFYYRMVRGKDMLAQWGLALILPGALGNAADRVLHPARGVVDFIMVDLGVWPADPWPIFNFADIYVTVGVGIIIASIIRDEIRARKGDAAENEAPSTGESTATASPPDRDEPNAVSAKALP